MKELLTSIANNRQCVEEIKKDLKEAKELLERTPIWGRVKALETAVRDINKRIRTTSDLAKEMAIEDDVVLPPGLKLINKTVVSFDVPEAIQWCINHNHLELLQLSSGFEKVAKELEIECVTITKEPQAQFVYKELDAYADQHGQERESADEVPIPF